MKRIFFFLSVGISMAVSWTLLSAPVYADQASCENKTPIKLEVGLGDLTTATSLTEYLAYLYRFIVSAIAVLSAAAIMLNGVRWAAAGGNAGQISKAKEGIMSAIIALVIALSSFILLRTLNPALVDLQPICPPGAKFEGQGSHSLPEGARCEKSADCADELICFEDSNYVNTCQKTEQRATGQVCLEDKECASGVCNTFSKTCTNGDETDLGSCDARHENCISGYSCDQKGTSLTGDDKCAPATVGADCDENSNCWDGTTAPELYCVDNDDDAFDSSCQNGAFGSPCDDDSECQQGSCVNDICI